MASSTVNLKALGLNFSPNGLELSPGSLIEADNVIIRRDDVIESRRGYKLFGEATPTSETIKQLMVYRQRIIRHYGSKLAYQDGVLNNGDAKFSVFSGDYTEVEPGLRIKSVRAKNGNFYFTTSEGVKKISAVNGDEFTTNSQYITQAGGIKALDLNAKTNLTIGDSESFLPENSTVAYKLVWGKIDANNVEILGTPSERVVVYNPLKTLLQMDLNRLFVILDALSSSTSLINDGNYYSSLKVTNETNAIDLRQNLINLTKKIDEDIVFANNVGPGSGQYQPLEIISSSANTGLIIINFRFRSNTITVTPTTTTITATGHTFANGDLVRFVTTGTLPAPLNTTTNYYIKNVATNSFEVALTYDGSSISITTTGTGVHTVLLNNHLKYFSVGQKINLTGFASNSVDIDNLNGNQIISAVNLSALPSTNPSITLLARDYSSTDPVGISGGISSYTGTKSNTITFVQNSATINCTNHGFSQNDVIRLTTTGTLATTTTATHFNNTTDYYVVGISTNSFSLALTASGTALVTTNNAAGVGTGVHTATLKSSFDGIVITTSTEHKLKDNQIVALSNTGSSFLDGNHQIIVKGPTSFQLTASVSGPIIAGSTGTWNISISSPSATTKIESNEYRSIDQPSEIVAAEDTGIVETRGTGAQLFSLQTYLSAIISKLKAEQNTVIQTAQSTNIGLSTFSLSKTASVDLEFTVPHQITDAAVNTFYYKLYRTETTQVNSLFSSPLEDILPGVDYRLAIQNYFDASSSDYDSTNHVLKVIDTVPSAFLNKENLYTNINTSTGPDAAPNDYPPFAHDINAFKGYLFYANTKLKQIKDLELLGVAKLKDELAASRTPKILISDGSSFNNCEISFVRGVKQITTITVPTVPFTSPAPSPSTNYIDINNATNSTQYRFWFDLTGSDVAPVAASKKLVRVYIPSNTQDPVGQRIADSLNMFVNDFSASYNSTTNIITINYINDGSANAVAFGAGASGFTSSISTTGVGESVTNKTAVISSNDLLLPSVATQEATKSFIRVINRNTAKQVDFDTYAYYSGTNPGLFLLEGTVFIDTPYYLSTNNDVVGSSFSPDISPLKTNGTGISNSSGAALLTFSSSHGFLNGEKIVITNSTTVPNIDGVYTVEYISSTQLKIQATVAAPGSYTFSYSKADLSEFSDNYKRKNRLYYSKFEQPEAVSVNVLTGNYIDVGSEERDILRIFPLRDSLFIFKQDGLFRLSAETEPFVVSLFDSSCILLAPDSVSVSQNIIYGWTTQGISTVSESGVTIASRPIDTEVLKLQSSNYTNFKTSTFGVGYESDNSYIVWTVKNSTDTYATQAFRYSSLTGTWTKYTKANTCGILNSSDDRLYLGVPTIARIEQERKAFAREDYADYEYDFTIGSTGYLGDILSLSSVSNLTIGDVITQDQTITVYQFNSLLKKLDSDPGVADNNYYSTLAINGGANLRAALVNLANKLDADTGVATNDFFITIDSKAGSITGASLNSPTVLTSAAHGLFTNRVIQISGAVTTKDINGTQTVTVISSNSFSVPVAVNSFTSGGTWSTAINNLDDIKACFNKIIQKLNADTNVVYSNYLEVQSNSLQEAIITKIDYIFNKVTLNKTLDFVQGPIKAYKAIQNSVVYAPNTFGDPLSFKQMREITAMFANKAFTSVSLSFSTDLLPAFIDVDFPGSGAGLFGNDEFGSNFFGGVSNSAPVRTIVPAECQRCRYLNIKFSHKTAREQYALYGITLTGRAYSTRAYR